MYNEDNDLLEFVSKRDNRLICVQYANLVTDVMGKLWMAERGELLPSLVECHSARTITSTFNSHEYLVGHFSVCNIKLSLFSISSEWVALENITIGDTVVERKELAELFPVLFEWRSRNTMFWINTMLVKKAES